MIIDRILNGRSAERDAPFISVDQWVDLVTQFSYQGVNYSVPNQPQEQIGGNFASLASQAFMSDSVVFACIAKQLSVFSEARFQFRQLRTGGPGRLFGTDDLVPLEQPWPSANTGDLLTRDLLYGILAGNAFNVRVGRQIRCLRPDWVTLVIGSDDGAQAWDANAEVVGIIYHPGGPNSGRDPVTYDARDVAHFIHTPDPLAQFRGMSPLTPLIREIMADKAAMDHKLKFFENGATPQLVVKLDTPDLEQYKAYIELFRSKNEGSDNAYKTLFLAAGADVTPVGADLKQIDFKATQGAGETRIAAALGVPPVLVGLSEGLASATYSNYAMARRSFADGTLRPMWRNLCGSLANIVTVPPKSELWYDESQIAFLREDEKDAAEIQSIQASTINSLITNGFDPDTAIDAVMAQDFSRLEHSGFLSVQLQPPPGGKALPVGSEGDSNEPADTTTKPANQNGNGNGVKPVPALN